MSIDQNMLRADPRRWPVLQRALRRRTFGAALVLIAGLLFVPAAWIVLMPDDIRLRPDITHWPAVAILVICPFLVRSGRRISREVWNDYGAELYACASRVRQAAAARDGKIFDIELPQIFPRVMFARKNRLMGVALPEPVLIAIDDISEISVTSSGLIRIAMKDPQQQAVHVVAGDGLAAQSEDETRYLADRLKEFAFFAGNIRTQQDARSDDALRDFLANPSLT